jgi:hypothetical protein
MGNARSLVLRVTARICAMTMMAILARPVAASAIYHAANDGDSYGIAREFSTAREGALIVIPSIAVSYLSTLDVDNDPPSITVVIGLPSGEGHVSFQLTSDRRTAAAVPEATSLLLFGTALVTLGIAARRWRRA